MLANSKQFSEFAASKLKAAVFETSYEDDASQIFHTSVDSSIHLMRWAQDAKNHKGESFCYYPAFVDIFSPNAFADRYQKDYYIGFHSALFVSISEFAMFCFAQKEFFPEMGDSSQEVSPEPWDHRVPGLWLLEHTKNGGHVQNEHSRRLIPKDPERFHLSTCLSFLMARFVWLHELCHCFNGHVDLAKEKGLAVRLHEVPPMNAVGFKDVPADPISTAEKEKILQHLEHDADQSAFWASVNLQLGNYENIQELIDMPEDQRLKIVLFASYVMPWLFEQYQGYMNADAEVKTHPEPMQRLEYLFETAKSRMLSQHPELIGLNSEALAQFDVVRHKIPNLYASKALHDLFDQASMVRHDANFDKFHQELLATLQPLQYSTK